MEFKDRTSRLLEEFAGRLWRAADLLGPVRGDADGAAPQEAARPRREVKAKVTTKDQAKDQAKDQPKDEPKVRRAKAPAPRAAGAASVDTSNAEVGWPGQPGGASLRWEPIDGGQSAMSACHSDGDHFEHVVRNRRGSWILSGSAEIYPEGSIEFPGMFAAKAEAQAREDQLVADLWKMNGGAA